MEPEEVLAGGNVSGPVVRAGATVRKLGTPATPAVEALLRYLNAGPARHGRGLQAAAGRAVERRHPGGPP